MSTVDVPKCEKCGKVLDVIVEERTGNFTETNTYKLGKTAVDGKYVYNYDDGNRDEDDNSGLFCWYCKEPVSDEALEFFYDNME